MRNDVVGTGHRISTAPNFTGDARVGQQHADHQQEKRHAPNGGTLRAGGAAAPHALHGGSMITSRRDQLVLHMNPVAVTLVSLSTGEVLSSNPASRAYFGSFSSLERWSALSSSAGSAMAPPCQAGGVLAQLFHFQRELLPEVLGAVTAGQEWQGVIPVPRPREDAAGLLSRQSMNSALTGGSAGAGVGQAAAAAHSSHCGSGAQASASGLSTPPAQEHRVLGPRSIIVDSTDMEVAEDSIMEDMGQASVCTCVCTCCAHRTHAPRHPHSQHPQHIPTYAGSLFDECRRSVLTLRAADGLCKRERLGACTIERRRRADSPVSRAYRFTEAWVLTPCSQPCE